MEDRETFESRHTCPSSTGERGLGGAEGEMALPIPIPPCQEPLDYHLLLYGLFHGLFHLQQFAEIPV